MREIKFRFWVEKAQKMSDWETAKKECDRLSLLALEGFIPMQFTGLKDKNGKDIYDGDILREPAKGQWEETNFIAYEIFWHDNDCCEHNVGFQLNRMHFYGAVGGGTLFFKFKPKDTAKLTIIGNIYQNPELINK